MRHYSIRTENVYCDWARRFILFRNKRHPCDMAANEVTAFLTFLANKRNVSASTQNQAKNALLFIPQGERGIKHSVSLQKCIHWKRKRSRIRPLCVQSSFARVQLP